jgi:thiosulfate reductase cytochrome b subunit
MHWINAIAMIILIMSGWEIYNDEIVLHWLIFPKWAVLGTWAATALQWHFFGMWILGLNGLAYLAYGLATGRFRRKLFPLRLGELVATVHDALTFRLGHDDITHYNAVQKLLYIGVIAVAVVQVMTGLAIWKPIQFPTLYALFSDFQTARLLHFLGMAAIVGFMVVHVSLALIAPKTLLAMLTGGPRVPPPPAGKTRA